MLCRDVGLQISIDELASAQQPDADLYHSQGNGVDASTKKITIESIAHLTLFDTNRP